MKIIFIGNERKMNLPLISHIVSLVLDSARGRKNDSKIPILTWALTAVKFVFCHMTSPPFYRGMRHTSDLESLHLRKYFFSI